MKKWKIAIPIVVIALFVAWYAFRPDLLVVNRRVSEALPTSQGASPAQALESGTFYGVVHPTEGTATIYRLADGIRILRFTNFKTSNGPDVHVYMLAADDAKDSDSVLRPGFVDLGTIKGEYWRPKLYSRFRRGLVEISGGFGVVQTVQRQFWQCPIDAGSSGLAELVL